METFKPINFSHGRTTLLAAACLILPLHGGEIRGAATTAATETARRSTAIDEAQELLKKGDEAYTAGRYAEAVEAYAGARELIPDAPVSAELRTATTERYAQAAVEQAHFLSRKGDIAAAKAVVDKVLMESVAPNNPGALACRAQLDDPIRTNPALTAGYTKDVDAVRRLLYTAQGASDLGKFDEAKATYQKILQIDSTNTAARRGMERLAAAKSIYYKSAADHTRAEMLAQLDSQWELSVPSSDLVAPPLDPGGRDSTSEPVYVRSKLDRIKIPKIALDQTTLVEALDFLRIRASENDTTELDPARKGVNFTVNLGAADSPTAIRVHKQRFDLQLTNVPLRQVLKYITEITQTIFTTDDFAVIISAAGSASADLVSRSYRVPPDFISSISSGATETPAADPFATAAPTGGLLAKRLGAQEALVKQGVAFPEGASATYLPTANTLRVVNTALNQDYISQIIDTLTKTEPVMVSVKVTMIKVQQTNLEELGFDSVLDNFGFGGPSWVGGTDKYNLSGGTQGNGSDLSDIPLPIGQVLRRPITAGNRSGDSAILGDSIDNLIANPSGRQASSRAPGVLRVFGKINDTNIQMMMRGLAQKKGVDVMAQPATVTRSGQSSTISVIREFTYPSEYEPPQIPNNVGNGGNNVNGGFGGGGGNVQAVTPSNPTAFKKRDVGMTLEVLPVADPDKRYVSVTLTPTFTDFDGFVNYGSPILSPQNGLLVQTTSVVTKNEILMPVFSKQSLTSSVNVADGTTVMVGGLIKQSVQNVEDHTPILGGIPILGRLFQSKSSYTQKNVVMFLVNVEIVDPTGHRYRDR